MNVLAVDVGTTSVRLAIVSFLGEKSQDAVILASHKKNIGHIQNGPRFEQSSEEIWEAVAECSRESIKKAQVDGSSIKGIAFSATCSLVVENDSNRNNVIMWMDHRAIAEAHKITNSDSKVLAQFGGICSPEFSLAKLVWLKNNEPKRLHSATGLFELPDWLVYRTIGGEPSLCARSLCCVTCKWGFDAEAGHQCDVINSLEVSKTGKFGTSVIGPGTVAGYMSSAAAAELGLVGRDHQDKENFTPMRVVVGTSLIDAHSGMLAMLSVPLTSFGINQKIESTFCSLAGTSSCHMLLSRERNFTHGIWGPYKDVVIEGYYLLEAGQTLTGRLLEMSIESHEEGRARLKAGEAMYDIIECLNRKLFGGEKVDNRLHVLPSFHGNRSPLANPRLRGGIYGLSAEGPASLVEHYSATLESLVYETKFIVETLKTKLDTMLVSGGLMKNEYYMQTLADVLGCKVVRMGLEGVDFMVMGSALVARHAVLSSRYSTFEKGINVKPLSSESIRDIQYRQLDLKVYQPRSELSHYHHKRSLCYKEFVELSKRIDKILYPMTQTTHQ